MVVVGRGVLVPTVVDVVAGGASTVTIDVSVVVAVVVDEESVVPTVLAVLWAGVSSLLEQPAASTTHASIAVTTRPPIGPATVICTASHAAKTVIGRQDSYDVAVLIVVSPAKTLDYESPLPTRAHSVPRMVDDAAGLIDVMVTKSPDEVASMMHLSAPLAELNVQRYQDWEPRFSFDNSRQAVLAFKGDVYTGMEIERFGTRDFTEAQKRIRILSGLYGVLRPLDLMQPYRLEMGTPLATDRGRNLYDFWGSSITDLLNADIAERKAKVLLNLASNEYFSAVRPADIDARVITPRFLDEKNGNYKVISFFAKKARGAMAAWIVLNRVKSAKGLLAFDANGYHHDPERSTADEPVFIRAEGVTG